MYVGYGLLTTRESASSEIQVKKAKTQKGERSGGHENNWTGGKKIGQPD